MSTKSQNVAIFWDYGSYLAKPVPEMLDVWLPENCHPMATATGYDIVNAIRQVGRKFGPIKLFKAYMELSQLCSPKLASLRSELQASGVSMTDCPHNGRKDVADKMILVDMLAFCIDNAAPATVVLISGDRDFAYALSVLRHRQYEVIILAPPMVHPSLTAQASFVFDWHAQCKLDGSTRSESKAPQESVTIRTSQAVSQSCAASTPAATTRRDNDTSTLNVSPQCVAELSRNEDHEVRVPPHHANPSTMARTSLKTNGNMPLSGGVMLSNYGPCAPITPHHKMPSLQDLARKLLQPATAMKQSGLLNTTEDLRRHHLGSFDFETSTGADEHARPVQSVSSPASPLNQDSVHSAKVLQVPSIVNAITSTSTNPLPQDTRAVRVGSSPMPHVNASNDLHDLQVDTDGVSITQPPSRSLWAKEQVMASALSSSNHQILREDGPGLAGSTAAQSGKTVSSTTNQSLASRPKACNNNFSRVTTTTPPTPVPAGFEPLITHLQACRQKGQMRPSRSDVAAHLNKNTLVYKKVGASKFRSYAALAEKGGLVELGRVKHGAPWISLAPAWCSR